MLNYSVKTSNYVYAYLNTHYGSCDWMLDAGKAMSEGNKWYFYSRRTQSRITGSGYWQPVGVEETIYSSGGQRVGMKKYNAFYIGQPSEGVKTNWIMQEYRLSDSSSSSSRSSSRRRNSKIVSPN